LSRRASIGAASSTLPSHSSTCARAPVDNSPVHRTSLWTALRVRELPTYDLTRSRGQPTRPQDKPVDSPAGPWVAALPLAAGAFLINKKESPNTPNFHRMAAGHVPKAKYRSRATVCGQKGAARHWPRGVNASPSGGLLRDVRMRKGGGPTGATCAAGRFWSARRGAWTSPVYGRAAWRALKLAALA